MIARTLASVCGLVLLTLALGCGSSEPTTASAPPDPTGGSAGGPPSGNSVFDAKCRNCHAFSSAVSGPPKSGPNLAKVGATRTPDWLADHIKNPQSHKPASKMPEFASKLNADELKSVTEFLAGLK